MSLFNHAEHPLVSVVIPSKNRLDFLLEALDSVFAQTYQNLEVIVVDDGSATPLGPMLKEKYGDRILFLRHEKSLGAPAARNAGARLASGEYIAFLDDDDLWLPEKISKQIECFKCASLPCALVGCSFAYVKNLASLMTCFAPYKVELEDGLFKLLLSRNVIGGCSVPLIKREALTSVGGFDESFKSCQDWDLWLRLLHWGDAVFVPDVLLYRRVHEGQITSNLKHKIAGRKRLLAKFPEEFANFPRTRKEHLRRLATLSLLDDDRLSALNGYLNVLIQDMLDWRSFCGVLLSMLPLKCGKILAERAGAMRLNGTIFYH
ncbi:glycosyltransferase family 2 protein [Desulfuromonas thiophila]|uniref:Glycosyltransferase, GT2 family n=1 Tax=Desulfuromonas thiophila TaxID=57664 RepID=A0A1G7ETQ3_9BACT|nr:glycosyltransferase family A protein [Desulfuromonas thiophila]SDE66991.1 Glycosyltransferase, GT2 family [Desulfuromonas thiophila]